MLMGRLYAMSDALRRHNRLALAGEYIDTALASYDMLFLQLRTQLTIDPNQVVHSRLQRVKPGSSPEPGFFMS